MGFLARVVGVFTAPGATFGDIARNPTVLVPLLLVVVVAVANAYITAPIAGRDQATLMEDSAFFQQTVPDDQREEALEAMRNPSPARRIGGAAAAGLGTVAMLAVFALILWGVGHLVGGEPTFKKTLSMLAFTAMISVVASSLVRLPLILSKETVFGVSLSPAILFPDAPVTSSTYRLLSILDLFAVWGVIAGGIGFGKVAGTSSGTGIAVLAIFYAILAGLGYFISGLFL